jgi:AbrB family looped-hinge helix DNA binding protein
MTEVHVRLDDSGRIAIPAVFRRQLGLKPGDPVILRLDGDAMVIEARRAACAPSSA